VEVVVKKPKRFRDLFVPTTSIPIFILLCVFVGYPLLQTLKLSFQEGDHWSLQNYIMVFERAWLRKSIFNSLLLATLAATCSVLIGYLFAFLLTRSKIKAKGFFYFIATLPIISPPFMLSLSVILLLGRNGFITKFLGLENFDIYGLPGILLVQSLSLFPLAFLNIYGVMQAIEGSIEDAALNLGASKFQTFLDVTLPLSLPGILSSWLLVFVTSLADFATPLLLSGKFDVLSVQAYLQFTGSGNLGLGAALSNLLIVPCLAAYFLQKHILQKRSYVTVTGKPQRPRRDLTTKFSKALLLGLAGLITAAILLLYGTVLAGAFTKSWGLDYSLSLENFSYVWSVGRQAIADTIVLSLIATPIAEVLGLLIAYLVVRRYFWGRKVFDVFALLPLALPGTAIGIGYVLAFNDYPILLTGTASIIILSFVFRNAPVAMEAAKASLMQIDPSIE